MLFECMWSTVSPPLAVSQSSGDNNKLDSSSLIFCNDVLDSERSISRKNKLQTISRFLLPQLLVVANIFKYYKCFSSVCGQANFGSYGKNIVLLVFYSQLNA